MPPCSDEHITIAQCLKSEGTSVSAVIVTTPQEVALIDVRKEISFCKKVGASPYCSGSGDQDDLRPCLP